MAKQFKQSRTIREYRCEFKGWKLTIPVGSIVSNRTACGYLDEYRFWQGWQEQIAKLTGTPNSILAHDLTYYGLNIPAEYCEPYAN